GHALRDRWLPTPRPLALLVRHSWGIPQVVYLLRARVGGATTLERFVSSLSALPSGERREALRRRIEQVALLLRLLHQRGVSHGRLSASGILVGDAPTPGQRLEDPEPWLAALDGI